MSKLNRTSFEIRPLTIAGLVAGSLLLGATASAASSQAPSIAASVEQVSFANDKDKKDKKDKDDEDEDIFDETIDFLEDILDWLT